VRVVLDTNVLISGIFFKGPPYRILKAWRANEIDLIVSREILEEYRRTAEILADRFPPVDLQAILLLIEKEAKFCDAPALPNPVCVDPDDDKFIACALSSGAGMIVSGDKHLLKVSGFQGIRVIRPREFVDTYLS
jgi:uncharacterized protein